MPLLTIGQAAAKLGIRTSALRYYDDRDLVRPAERRSGRRYYGAAELRKVAFLQLLRELDIDLEMASRVFDPARDGWRDAVEEQITQIEHRLLEAQVARAFLTHMLECPADHPTRDCPTMLGILDDVVDGTSIEALAERHGLDLPPRVPAKRFAKRRGAG